MNSTNPSPPMEASKWLQTQVLLETEEMENLLFSMAEMQIFITGRVIKKGEEIVSHEQFLHKYNEYVSTLRSGKVPEDGLYRSYFSSIWTLSSDVVDRIKVDQERQVLRVKRPVIQLQLHRWGYSFTEGKFRPMIFGKDSIDWGIQFSYPQLFKDPLTHEAHKVDSSENFPNTILFQHLQRWLRQYSQPTPFVVDGKKTNVPIRLGKKCFSWINCHPQLIEKKMQVENVGN